VWYSTYVHCVEAHQCHGEARHQGSKKNQRHAQRDVHPKLRSAAWYRVWGLGIWMQGLELWVYV
jgi:hypothetical protein